MINHPETGEPHFTMDELKMVLREMVRDLIDEVMDLTYKKLWERLHGRVPFGEKARPLDIPIAAPLSVAFVAGREWIATVPISTTGAEAKATKLLVQ